MFLKSTLSFLPRFRWPVRLNENTLIFSNTAALCNGEQIARRADLNDRAQA